MLNQTQKLSGFTIVEAALSVAIVAILLVASTATFGAIGRSRQSQNESRLAYLLAQQLMTEIFQCAFQPAGTNPAFGPLNGQTRATFAYVDAYNGYSANPPTSKTGTNLAGYGGWSISAAVSFVNPGTFAPAVSSNLKQITVNVVAPSGKTYTLQGLRSQFGVYEVQPASQINLVTGVAVSLQGASTGKPVYSSAHPLNITSSQ